MEKKVWTEHTCIRHFNKNKVRAVFIEQVRIFQVVIPPRGNSTSAVIEFP
jgi:hypothetical protein